MPQYDKIFKPETLATLKGKSKESLRQMLGNKSLMQAAMNSQRLLTEIQRIEAPYIDELEEVAIQMAKDAYPVLDYAGISIDAKLADMSGVERELNELEVNKPFSLIKGKRYILKGHEGSVDMLVTYIGPTFNKKGHNFGSTRLGPITTIPNTKIKDQIKPLNESQQPFTPEFKRRIINGITQGSAVRGTFGFLLFREYLDQLDPTLVDKYKELMNNVFGSYDDDNGVAMFLQMIQQGHKMGGGSSKVIIGGNINESQSEPSITIKARAICFPMLVHEIIKGLYEILSLQGFQGTKQQNQDVVNKVDKLEHEPEDLQVGKFIYDAISDIYNSSNYDDPRIREYLFTEIYKLPDEEFIIFIENAINKTLTKSQLSWVNNIMKEIESDLKADDAKIDID